MVQQKYEFKSTLNYKKHKILLNGRRVQNYNYLFNLQKCRGEHVISQACNVTSQAHNYSAPNERQRKKDIWTKSGSISWIKSGSVMEASIETSFQW